MTMTFSVNRDLQELLATVPADHPRLLVGYLSTNNKERNERASKVFVGAGTAAVPMLVREAIIRGKRPQHRIRLLDIGAPLGVNDWMTLLSGTGMYPGPGAREDRRGSRAPGPGDGCCKSPWVIRARPARPTASRLQTRVELTANPVPP